jgi:hypothetical protein
MLTPVQQFSSKQAAKDLSVSKYFQLSYSMSSDQTVMEMKLLIPQLTTAELPQTYPVLQNHLPTIFKCQCFNNEKIPFSKEVLKTEIGHLYEHIVLEYLCDEHCRLKRQPASYSGVTSWNWVEHPRGTFTISLSVGFANEKMLKTALVKGAQLLNQIIHASNQNVLKA